MDQATLQPHVYIDYPELPEVQEYCYYRRQSRPEFRRFTPNVPIYAIWDDHDFAGNDSIGGPQIDVPAWKRPVWHVFRQNWVNPYYGGGLKLDLSDNLSLTGDWTVYEFDILETDVISLGFNYRF